MGYDHLTSVHGTPPGYKREGSLGIVSLAPVTDGRKLFSCKENLDTFLSTDPGCEDDGTAVAHVGWLWGSPPDGLPSLPLYRCMNGQETFESLSDTCEGRTVDRELGYVLIPPEPVG